MLLCVSIKWTLLIIQRIAYNEIVEQFEEISSKLLITDIRFIPISALLGDNVVNPSTNMKWYEGFNPFTIHLETLHISSDTK